MALTYSILLLALNPSKISLTFDTSLSVVYNFEFNNSIVRYKTDILKCYQFVQFVHLSPLYPKMSIINCRLDPWLPRSNRIIHTYVYVSRPRVHLIKFYYISYKYPMHEMKIIILFSLSKIFKYFTK